MQQQQAVPTQTTAVQPPPPPPNQQTTAKPSASISQPAQRYDYSVMPSTTTAQPGPQTNYDPTYASNMMQMQRTPQQAKWNSMLAATNGTNAKKTSNFQRNRGNRNPSGQSVQIFYCEVCKISCAGPQTYKEHLDGQKHKKREQASKLSTEQAAQPTSTSPSQNWKRGRNHQNFSRNSVVIKCELCDVACTGRDAYTAHVRGMKHQKTLKLHQKLGKPIPPDALDILYAAANVMKTVTPTTTISAPVPYPQANVATTLPTVVTVNRPPLLTKTVVNQPMVTDLEQTTEMNLNTQLDEQNMDQDEQVNIEPIGREYIETRLEGKILSFFCKLCECQFNDPNAKDMHTKGRRHRLAYKKKVDPSLRVDMKSSSTSLMSRNKQLRERNLNTNRYVTSPTLDILATNIMPLMSASIPDVTQPAQQQTIQQLMSQPLKPAANTGANYNWSYNANNFQSMRQGETFDDRHIIAKHNQIYPSQEEINAIQEIVNSTEKALKLVSDQIAEE